MAMESVPVRWPSTKFIQRARWIEVVHLPCPLFRETDDGRRRENTGGAAQIILNPAVLSTWLEYARFYPLFIRIREISVGFTMSDHTSLYKVGILEGYNWLHATTKIRHQCNIDRLSLACWIPVEHSHVVSHFSSIMNEDSSRLRHLAVYLSTSTRLADQVMQQMPVILNRAQNLTFFGTNAALGQDAWNTLPRLPHLRVLKIDKGPFADAPASLSLGSVPSGFPALEELIAPFQDALSMRMMALAIVNPSFSSFTATFLPAEGPSPMTMAEFMAQLVQRPYSSSLKTIILRDENEMAINGEGTAEDLWNIVKPFLELEICALQYFGIGLYAFNADGSFFERFHASRPPTLQIFDIHLARGTSNAPLSSQRLLDKHI
jgi:hypothetical protein